MDKDITHSEPNIVIEEVVCIFITGLEGLLRRSNIKTFLKLEVLSLIRGSRFRSFRSLECGIRNAQLRRKDCGTKMSNW